MGGQAGRKEERIQTKNKNPHVNVGKKATLCYVDFPTSDNGAFRLQQGKGLMTNGFAHWNYKDLHVNVNVSCGMVPRFNTFFFAQEARCSREVAWAVQWCTGVGLDRAAVARGALALQPVVGNAAARFGHSGRQAPRQAHPELQRADAP